MAPRKLIDSWIKFDMGTSLTEQFVAEAKRGSKRLHGRITAAGRHKTLIGDLLHEPKTSDMFFDSTSPLHPWYK